MKEVIKKVKKIEIKTKGLVDGLLQGAYHSVFKGRGIEFSEVREYSYGDAVKTIDWNVTARMNAPYVKEFVEERDLTCYIVFDASASAEFGFEKEKQKTGIEIAASMILAAQKNNDNIGLFIFTDKIEKHVPARKGRRHALSLISELVRFIPDSKQTNIEMSLEKVARVLKRKSILFIISDFDSLHFEKSLKMLRHKHDVIPINITDIRENTIPNVGLIELEDPETEEEFIIDTSDENLIKKYYQLLKNENAKIDKLFKKNKMNQIKILSGEDFRKPLQTFFRKRAVLR